MGLSRPEKSAKREAAMVEAWTYRRARTRRLRHVDQRTVRLFIVRHVAPREKRCRKHQARETFQAYRLSETRRGDLLRPAHQFGLFRHQPRRGSTGSPAAHGSFSADPSHLADLRRTSAALLPGGGL